MLIAFMHARRLELFVLQTREHSVSTLHEVNQDSTSPCLMTLPLPLRNDNLPTLDTCPISPPTRPVSPPLLDSRVPRVLTPLSSQSPSTPHYFIYSVLYPLRIHSLLFRLSPPPPLPPFPLFSICAIPLSLASIYMYLIYLLISVAFRSPLRVFI